MHNYVFDGFVTSWTRSFCSASGFCATSIAYTLFFVHEIHEKLFMFSRLDPASLSLSSAKSEKGGKAVFRNEHNHYGFAVREFPFWFCSLFRFSGRYHFLVTRPLQGKHFRRNPLSHRYTWRRRGPVSKVKDVRRHLLPWHRIRSAAKRPVSFKQQPCFHFTGYFSFGQRARLSSRKL